MNAPPDGPIDEGLQPERTILAWRRTALTLAAGSVAAARLLPEHYGWWTLILALTGIACSVAVYFAGHRRYLRHRIHLANPELPGVGASASTILAAAVLCTLIGVAGVVVTIAGHV
jgi:uncharacterized membrane protein YidH (DUF202 family)